MLTRMRKTVADYLAYDEERVELIDRQCAYGAMVRIGLAQANSPLNFTWCPGNTLSSFDCPLRFARISASTSR